MPQSYKIDPAKQKANAAIPLTFSAVGAHHLIEVEMKASDLMVGWGGFELLSMTVLVGDDDQAIGWVGGFQIGWVEWSCFEIYNVRTYRETVFVFVFMFMHVPVHTQNPKHCPCIKYK